MATKTTKTTKTINPRYVREGDEYVISNPNNPSETIRVKVTHVEKRQANYWEKELGNVIYRIWHKPAVTGTWAPRWYYAFVARGSKDTITVSR